MEYCKRLPLISPGTLIATSQGVAVYIAHGSMQGISRSLVRIKRNGIESVELSDESS